MHNGIPKLSPTLVAGPACQVSVKGGTFGHIKHSYILSVRNTGGADLRKREDTVIDIYLSPRPWVPPGHCSHFNIHISMELRDSCPWQPTPQVEPVTVLRHHMLHLEVRMW